MGKQLNLSNGIIFGSDVLFEMAKFQHYVGLISARYAERTRPNMG
jgi:hypothetical protein